MDKRIGQRITTVEQGIEGVLEGVVVAVAHDHGEDGSCWSSRRTVH